MEQENILRYFPFSFGVAIWFIVWRAFVYFRHFIDFGFCQKKFVFPSSSWVLLLFFFLRQTIKRSSECVSAVSGANNTKPNYKYYAPPLSHSLFLFVFLRLCLSFSLVLGNAFFSRHVVLVLVATTGRK